MKYFSVFMFVFLIGVVVGLTVEGLRPERPRPEPVEIGTGDLKVTHYKPVPPATRSTLADVKRAWGIQGTMDCRTVQP